MIPYVRVFFEIYFGDNWEVSVAAWLKPCWCLLTWGCWLGGGPLYPFWPMPRGRLQRRRSVIEVWMAMVFCAAFSAFPFLLLGGALVLCGGKYGGGIAST